MPMAQAVESCVHCGFCLAACPTYLELGEEMDSPRGRIILMKEVLEGELEAAQAAPYVDRCLGCLACEPACPSGVAYHRLLHPFREIAHRRGADRLTTRLRRALLHRVLPSRRLFRCAAAFGRACRWMAPVLPAPWRALLDWSQEARPAGAPATALPEQVAAVGERRAGVALLSGCVQEVLAPELNRAAVRVLARNGVEVVVPRRQACCGALALHDGRLGQARALARRTLAVFAGDVDAVVTTTAGCGSGIAEYPDLFRGTADARRATDWSSRAQDIHVFLARLGMVEPPPLAEPLTVAYQDACHLRQARGIVAEPRACLEVIPNLRLEEIGDQGLCCGSAGTYNLEHPQVAASLGERKAERILATGADVVASGNIGCMVQLRRHLRLLGSSLPVVHVVEILDRAYAAAAHAGR